MGFSLIRGKALRVTKLDGCGNRVLGPQSVVVTDGFTTVAYTANTTQGDAISVTNAAGKECVSDTPPPEFTGYTVNLTFCQVEPYLFTLLTGQEVVLSADGTSAVGIDIDTQVSLDGTGFALETWSSVPTGACAGGAQSYGYLLLPFLQGGILGDFTVENAAITFTVQGAITKDGNAWGVGTYDVVLDDTDTPGPLNTALSTTNHLHLELTQVAPPAPDGVEPLGVPATSAVAGTPGSYLPTNSYGRANLTAMTGLTASPTTAWTTGQYVTMLDGNKAHWTSSAWAAGAA